MIDKLLSRGPHKFSDRKVLDHRLKLINNVLSKHRCQTLGTFSTIRKTLLSSLENTNEKYLLLSESSCFP